MSSKRKAGRRGCETQNSEEGPSTSSASQQPIIEKCKTEIEIQHLFTHFFLGEQYATEARLDKLVLAYNEKYKMKLTKPGLISSNNRVLRPFGFQIKRIFDSIYKVTYYILANEIEDKLNISNTWSEKESNYYYAVLNTLIQSFMDKHQNMNPESIDYEFMSIGSTSAVNLARTVDITMTLADKLINYWTEMHWFEFCADKRITVGILTLSLMTSYLKKKFNIASCYSCSFACLIGIVCEQCSLTMHYHCGLEGFPSNDSYIRCPICITSKMSEVKCILPEREESSQSMERDTQDNETQDNDTQDVTMIDSD